VVNVSDNTEVSNIFHAYRAYKAANIG
jgi:hypothetical protein